MLINKRYLNIILILIINGLILSLIHFSLGTYKKFAKLTFSHTTVNKRKLPNELNNIPMADQLGIISLVSDISIPGIDHPYNPALIAQDDGYLLFYRHDYPYFRQFTKYIVNMGSNIGCIQLNNRFSPIKDPILVKTNSPFSEDPRVIKQKDNIYLIYNELFPTNEYAREMKMARLNPQSLQPENIWSLNHNIQPVEKNWTPFITEHNVLHFIYNLFPHKVLKSNDSNVSQLDFLTSNLNQMMPNIPWNTKWGAIRGGTPAILINGEYLSFFHSRFTCKKKITWYVMGAYTFSSAPPYELTSISQFPLIFKNIYESSHSPTANPNLRCIFPSGIELEETKGKYFVYVACGENDSAIKLITIDYEKLKQAMMPVLSSTQ